MNAKILIPISLFYFSFGYSMQPQSMSYRIMQGAEKIYNIICPEDEVFENLTAAELNDRITEIQTKIERADGAQKDLNVVMGVLCVSLFVPLDKIKFLKKIRYIEEGRLALAICVGLCSTLLNNYQSDIENQLNELKDIKNKKK